METSDLETSTFTHLEKIEVALVDLLKDRLGQTYYIDRFPDKPASFDTTNIEKLALVQYSGSTYSTSDGTGAGTQERRGTFAIHLQFDATGSKVRGPYEIEMVRLALQGQRIEGSDIAMLRDGLTDHDEENNLWKYLVEIGVTLPAVATPRRRIAPFVTNFAQAES